MFQLQPGILSRAAIDTGPGGATDPNFANVQLLVGFNGTDAAASAIDESSSARALTFVGNAQLDTAQFKFGSASLLLDGSGDAVTTPFATAFRFTGVFTIEGWIRFPTGIANGSYSIISTWQGSGTRSFHLFWTKGSSSRGISFAFSTDGIVSAFTTTNPNIIAVLVDATQHHIAVDRDASNKMRLYVNGVMQASTVSGSGTNFNTATPVNFGGAANGYVAFNGHLDEWRVTNGTSRYGSVSGDASFTPPSAEFPRS